MPLQCRERRLSGRWHGEGQGRIGSRLLVCVDEECVGGVGVEDPSEDVCLVVVVGVGVGVGIGVGIGVEQGVEDPTEAYSQFTDHY